MPIRDWRLVRWALAAARGSGNALVALAAVLVTPLLEKNPAKVLTTRARVVFSAERVIILAFAVAMLRQVWRAGVAGWPDATLCIAIVLAWPIVGALNAVEPAQVLAFGEVLLNRFGVGGVRPSGSVYAIAQRRDPTTAAEPTP